MFYLNKNAFICSEFIASCGFFLPFFLSLFPFLNKIPHWGSSVSKYFFGSRNQWQVQEELCIQITGLKSKSSEVFKGLFVIVNAVFSSRNCPFPSIFICFWIKVQWGMRIIMEGFRLTSCWLSTTWKGVQLRPPYRLSKCSWKIVNEWVWKHWCKQFYVTLRASCQNRSQGLTQAKVQQHEILLNYYSSPSKQTWSLL